MKKTQPFNCSWVVYRNFIKIWPLKSCSRMPARIYLDSITLVRNNRITSIHLINTFIFFLLCFTYYLGFYYTCFGKYLHFAKYLLITLAKMFCLFFTCYFLGKFQSVIALAISLAFARDHFLISVEFQLIWKKEIANRSVPWAFTVLCLVFWCLSLILLKYPFFSSSIQTTATVPLI